MNKDVIQKKSVAQIQVNTQVSIYVQVQVIFIGAINKNCHYFL